MKLDATTIPIITASIALISLVGKPYIDAIYKEYPPDIKKHISLIKKSFALILSILAPIAGIVYLLVTTNLIDKWFVLLICLNVGFMLMSINLELIKLYNRKQDKNLQYVVDAMKQHMSNTGTLLDIVKGHSDDINTLKNRF